MEKMEKSDVPVYTGAKSNKKRNIAVAASLFTVALFWNLPSLARGSHSISGGNTPQVNKINFDSWCPIPEVSSTADDGLDSPSKFLEQDAILKQVERMAAAVKVPTESFDDNDDVDVDPRWAPFEDLHATLKEMFPLVHEKMKLDKVNKYGLIYTLPGTSENLKPVLFAAHQDVVPATSVEKWTHPPFEGHFDGKWLWGRGSVDCKNNLIGLYSVMEDLLSQNFKPKRTIVFAFGFDEETGGKRGAKTLGAELEKQWGQDNIAMILDEGGMGLDILGDYVYAMPGVAEKGYLDIILTIDVDGGHSSRPPPHTSIGIMSELLVELEAHPYTPRLTRENPFRNLLECQVKYSPGQVEAWLGQALAANEDEGVLGERLAETRADERFIFQTSQAADVIWGGKKVNALPESVHAEVNYRVSAHDAPLENIKEKAVSLLRPIAQKHGLALNVFGAIEEPATLSAGKLTFDLDQPLEPAPISSTNLDNPVWTLFSGTIRQVFENIPSLEGRTVVPVGDIMTGNTDTQHYWNLTKNIYRYGPGREGTRLNAHTVDERIEMLSHVEAMVFYYDLIRNFDQAGDL
ncbi:putative vacuolar carboxypeptidase protein [Neofusicoccum parvum UCRNP2]|uniref:Vacuolar carboxypeptidase n=2 Tax=Neofusicoccum parvum TaxID=310453 RepID=A0ACB5RSG1_9PEZI|nr:putative vacuolar carboxypeptidase protein [Neofusicoccum parvum UCRNP2]GME23086.1 Vacuolar carboxypeptidase [Neofusicoccum parvum]